MFGFSTMNLLVAFYVAISLSGSLLVMFICMASRNSSQVSDRIFTQYKLEKKNPTPVTKSTLPSHARPAAAHRFFATAEAATEEEETPNKSVQRSGEQTMSKGPIRS